MNQGEYPYLVKLLKRTSEGYSDKIDVSRSLYPGSVFLEDLKK